MIKGRTYECRKVMILLIALIMSLLAFSPVFGLEITIQPHAIVKGDMIRLGDIAQFNPVNDSRVSQLSKKEILASPSPGSDSTINKDLLIYKINPYISEGKDILIKMPENLIVRRTAQYIDAGRIKEIFMGYIKDNSSWSEEQIQVEDINAPESIVFPEGKLEWNVQNRSNSDLTGNVTLIIDFRVDDKLVKKVNVSGKVSIARETIKAARKIARGQIITADDITLISEVSSHYRKDLVINKEDAIGKRTLGTIQADQAILFNMIENPPLVKKGDKVIIKAENAELRITVPGEALQDGQTGDQVDVLNLQSGKKLSATVRGSGLVEVIF